MSDLFGNHIVGFPTRWLNYAIWETDLNLFPQLYEDSSGDFSAGLTLGESKVE